MKEIKYNIQAIVTVSEEALDLYIKSLEDINMHVDQHTAGSYRQIHTKLPFEIQVKVFKILKTIHIDIKELMINHVTEIIIKEG